MPPSKLPPPPPGTPMPAPGTRLSFDGCVRVEVIRDGDPFRFMGRKRIKAKPTWRVMLEGEGVAQLARLWAALPGFGYDTMCHNPAFGFRLFDAEGEVLACVAPCFQCHNINIYDSTDDEYGTMLPFDADSPQGQEMLAFLRGLGPDPNPSQSNDSF